MGLKLNAIRIQNFKSIKDTGWVNLSIDNITALIGQNEAGKTSVLEGIYSFFSGKVYEDNIRSDNSFPEISCSFIFNTKKEISIIKEFFEEEELPLSEDILKILCSKNRLNLTRKWKNEENDELFIEEKDLQEVVKKSSQSLINEIKKLNVDIKELNKKIEETQVQIKNLTAKNNNEKDATQKSQRTNKIAELNNKIKEFKSSITEKTELLKTKNATKENILTEENFINIIFELLPEVIMFQGNKSLLPNEIDLKDLEEKNTKATGYYGVLNFMKIAGISLESLTSSSPRIIENKISEHNEEVTADFQEFWSQKIGVENKIQLEFDLKHHSAANTEKAGTPYMVFWIKNGREKLYLKQRSSGVRWFLSFYLQLKASEKRNTQKEILFLIDEPGSSLHAKAQEDALKVFDEIQNKNIQIIYTTHSPYFITLDKIYRILAVQRDEKHTGNTTILDYRKIGSASTNTLFPLFTVMGVSISSQNVIEKQNNVILEEISAFYYLKAFSSFFKEKVKINFLPATGVSNVEQLVYLFIGWGLDFRILIDDDSQARKVYKTLKKNLYNNNQEEAKKYLLKIKNCKGIEDIFTKNDFKKFVLKNESLNFSGKTNAEYIKKPKYSKPILALEFWNNVKNEKLKFDDFNKNTQEKIKEVINNLNKSLLSY